MTPELFDTHCHLTFDQLRPRVEEVIHDAVCAGVTRMITVACQVQDVEEALRLQSMHDQLWVAAGIHPHEAGKVNEENLQRLAELWRAPGIVAAGEMGLDYHYDFSPGQLQQKVFHHQLDLASETDLPVVVHCREAHADVVQILTQHGYVGKPVVFHCFSGSLDEAAELWANGWCTSFTGIITFKNAEQLQETCARTPQEQLMFETDAPYLSPEPVRNKRPNEPQNLVHTLCFAAKLRSQTFESLAAASTANALRFFGLSHSD